MFSDYYQLFKNVTRDRDGAVMYQGLAEVNELDSDPENFCKGQLEEIRYDEFKNFDKTIEKFKNELHISEKNSKDFLYSAVF